MTLFFFHDNRADVGDQILIGRTFAEKRPKVMIFLAEQAGPELAIGSQPDARAMAAEGLGHRGDEADFAGHAVGKAVFAGGLATLVGHLYERPTGVDALVDFGGGDYQFTRPVAVRVEGHELDKAHDDAGLAGKQSEGFDLVVVEATD